MLLEKHYSDCLDDMIDEWHTTNTELTLQEYLCMEDKDFQEFVMTGKINVQRILGTIQETLQRIDYTQFDSSLQDKEHTNLTVADFKKLLSVCNIKLNCKHSNLDISVEQQAIYKNSWDKYIMPLASEDVDFYTYEIKVDLKDLHQLMGIAYQGGI